MKKEKVKRVIRNSLTSAINETIGLPDFQFRINEINFIPKTNIRNNEEYEIIQIKILTNNRPLLLGQFQTFPVNGLRGFHSNYFLGSSVGYLRGKYNMNFFKKYDICLDVHQTENHKENLYRYITVSEAKDRNMLTHDSHLGKAMEKYGLQFILLAGDYISGPSIDMMRVLEKVQKEKKISNILDLFSGTGSLSKVALQNGANHTVCVENNPEVLEPSLKQYKKKYEILNQDVFNFCPNKFYSLVILDPFYYQSLKVAKALLPKLTEYGKTFILNIVEAEKEYWSKKVSNELKKNFKILQWHHGFESSVAVFEPR